MDDTNVLFAEGGYLMPMKLKGPEFITCDVLVIGGGGAGLRAAIQAREKGAAVLLAAKSLMGLGNNTAISKAAFAAVIPRGEPQDSPEVHLQDTLEGGRFINDRRLVEKLVTRIKDEVSFLEKCGVVFQTTEGKLAISRAPGHSYARHFHSAKRIGTDFTLPLKEYATKIGVHFMERVFITRLLERNGKAAGATGLDSAGRLLVFTAKATVLATGGFGQIYRHTNNAAGMTGDGHALAFRRGIPLRDMEFVQFYPTTIGGIRTLLYEAFVLRSNAVLRNSRGENIIEKHGLQDPMLMTRDNLTRVVIREIMAGNDVDGGVIMDLSPVPEATLMRLRPLLPPAALSGKREFIVSPAAHFAMGGVVTDDEARTPLPGLLACGEVVGGTHGANRLAGNALAEVFAMGAVAGESAAKAASAAAATKPDAAEVAAEKARLESLFGEGKENAKDMIRALKEIAWHKVGIIRHRSGLEDAVKGIGEMRSRAGNVGAADLKGLTTCLELDNMLLVAEMVAQAALERKESRGSHYREDYPEEDPAWRVSLRVNNQQGKITLEKKPV